MIATLNPNFLIVYELNNNLVMLYSQKCILMNIKNIIFLVYKVMYRIRIILTTKLKILYWKLFKK